MHHVMLPGVPTLAHPGVAWVWQLSGAGSVPMSPLLKAALRHSGAMGHRRPHQLLVS